MRAQNAVIRQQPGVRPDLVEILGDRQRVPYRGAVVPQARHQDRRRQQQDFGPRRRIVRRGDDLVELQPGKLRQQPAAQRPGRIVLAADGQCRFRHMALPSRLNDRQGHAGTALPSEPPQMPSSCLAHFMQQATCQFASAERPPPWRRYCMAPGAGADPDDVDDVSSLSEPHGPDGAMADGGRAALKYLNLVPQGVSDKLFGRLAAALELISRSSLTYTPPGLRHRQRDGRQPGTTRSSRKSSTRRRSARCCISGRRMRRSSRACCWWRRCPAISPRCCAAP